MTRYGYKRQGYKRSPDRGREKRPAAHRRAHEPKKSNLLLNRTQKKQIDGAIIRLSRNERLLEDVRNHSRVGVEDENKIDMSRGFGLISYELVDNSSVAALAIPAFIRNLAHNRVELTGLDTDTEAGNFRVLLRKVAQTTAESVKEVARTISSLRTFLKQAVKEVRDTRAVADGGGVLKVLYEILTSKDGLPLALFPGVTSISPFAISASGFPLVLRNRLVRPAGLDALADNVRLKLIHYLGGFIGENKPHTPMLVKDEELLQGQDGVDADIGDHAQTLAYLLGFAGGSIGLADTFVVRCTKDMKERLKTRDPENAILTELEVRATEAFAASAKAAESAWDLVTLADNQVIAAVGFEVFAAKNRAGAARRLAVAAGYTANEDERDLFRIRAKRELRSREIGDRARDVLIDGLTKMSPKLKFATDFLYPTLKNGVGFTTDEEGIIAGVVDLSTRGLLKVDEDTGQYVKRLDSVEIISLFLLINDDEESPVDCADTSESALQDEAKLKMYNIEVRLLRAYLSCDVASSSKRRKGHYASFEGLTEKANSGSPGAVSMISRMSGTLAKKLRREVIGFSQTYDSLPENETEVTCKEDREVTLMSLRNSLRLREKRADAAEGGAEEEEVLTVPGRVSTRSKK